MERDANESYLDVMHVESLNQTINVVLAQALGRATAKAMGAA
jgi:hypothetical protein